MTDRDLLEKAAKAAGIEAQWDCPERGMMMLTPDGIDTMTWNSLADDGDALRLAVKLRIGVKYHHNAPPEMGLPRECAVAVTDSGKWFAEVDRDEGKATRRAIVRAAATLCE